MNYEHNSNLRDAEPHSLLLSGTTQDWASFNGLGPIVFQSAYSAGLTMRLTPRPNAATISPSMIYDFNLDGLYNLYDLISWNSYAVLPSESFRWAPQVLWRPGYLRMQIDSQITEPSNPGMVARLPVYAVMDAFECLQELSHFLAIQEMDFEMHYEDRADPASGQQLIAKGCLAFDDTCGPSSGPQPVTKLLDLQNATKALTLPHFERVDYDWIDPISSTPVPANVFADQACLFYYQLMQYTLRGGGPFLIATGTSSR
ncbi:MAG: hypothetical protein Q9222_006913 [Ikaeria aurantiellina]